MRTTKKILSLMLSLMLAFSAFAVIPASALAVSTVENYKNITFVDESQESNTASVSFADKKAKLTAFSNYEGTQLELNGIDNAYLSNKYGSLESVVSGYTIKPYKGTNKAYDTPTEGTLGATDVAYLKDKSIFDASSSGTSWGPQRWVNGEGGTSYERWWYDTHENSTEGILYGAERVEAGYYDLDMTVALNDYIAIDSIYISGHPNLSLSPVTYGIFVGNTKDDLYNDENLVAYYDYYNSVLTGNMDNTYAFNNPGNSKRNSETQVWDFASSKPMGKFVGIRAYDMSKYDPSNKDAQFSFYDLNVYGKVNLSYVDETKATNHDTATKTFAEKEKLLNAYSNYNGTTLELYGMDTAYLNANYVKEDNKLYGKTAEIKYYSGDTGSTALTAVTDFSIYDATQNPANGSSYGSTGQLTNKGYEEITTDTVLYGEDRISKGYYDADMIIDLGNTTELSDFYMICHPNSEMAITSYGLFISDDKTELFDDNNLICVYDYYLGAKYKNSEYKFNMQSSRTSEGQIWKFTGADKPEGKYLGIRLYDGSTYTTGFLYIYELGAYGRSTVPVAVADAVKVESGSSSARTTVVCENEGVSATVADENGNAVEELFEGMKYTFTATAPSTDGYYFAGWYSGDTLLSSELVYTADSYNGATLTAKYLTDRILDIKAGEDVVMKSYWPNTNTTTLSYTYDAEEDAMVATNSSETNLAKGSLVTALTSNGSNALNVQYNPWTTYKYTVVAKLVDENNIWINVGMGAHSLLLQQTSSVSIQPNRDYKEYTVYFNSGAANWKGSANNATSVITGNMFNYNLVAGASMYIKSITIEEVNNVKVTAEKATVELTDNSYLNADFNGNCAAADSTDYDGNISISSVSAWLIGKLNGEGFYGAAKTGDTISFKVTPDVGYAVESVTVGGVPATEENGVYSAVVPAGTAYSGISQAVSDYVEIDVKTVEAHVCVFDQKVATDDYKATDATCTAAATYYYSCVCGEKGTETFASGDVNAENHTGKEVVVSEAVAATCTTKGMTEATKWDCCNAPIKVATETAIDPANHEAEVAVSSGNKDATHTESGWEGRTVWECCNVVETKGNATDALGHQGTAYDEVSATCTEAGTKAYFHCDSCDKNYESDAYNAAEITDLVIPANGHDGEAVEAVAATCTEAGNVAYYKCLVCNKNFEGNSADAAEILDVVIPAKGHDGEEVEGKAASCTESGILAHYACAICGKNFDSADATAQEITDVTIAPTAHYGAELIEEVPATCVATGTVAHYHCDKCGKDFSADEVPGVDSVALDDLSIAINLANHADGCSVIDSEDNKPATETEPGLEGKTVYSRCGQIANEGTVIPALGYTVNFRDHNKEIIYTVQIQKGESAVAAGETAETKLPARFGYSFSSWSDDLTVINGAMEVYATYVRDDAENNAITINDEEIDNVSFDTKITVKASEKALWTVNGQKFHIGESAVVYAFGNMDIKAEKLPDDINEEEAFVSLLGTIAQNGEFIAFVHVYAGNNTVSEYGARFWNAENSYENAPKYQNIVVTNGNDAMITLYGIGAGKQRGVKAYAKLSDGSEIVSDNFASHSF